jgi:predicted ATPase/tetratricopeptide (TPR) repeat protein
MSRRGPPRTNLPVERGAFVGRERALIAVARALGDGQPPVVVLVGPAGIGKTRLALRAASRELPRFGHDGGVWLIECVGVDDGAGLQRVIGLTLGILPDPSASPATELSRLASIVGERGPGLLIVDAIDGVPDAIDTLVCFVEACPGMRVIATRRDVVGPVVSVQSFTVGPLAVARREQRERRADDVSEAALLFLERANEARGTHTRAADAADLVAIDAIAKHLDGVPQAIELAAARCRVLSPAELLERLPRHLGALQPAGKRSALAGVVAWSLDLLQPWERATLAQCVVFHGGFTIDAATAVVDLSELPGSPPVGAVVESLVDKALLKAMPVDDDSVQRFAHPPAVRDLIVNVRPQRRADGGHSGAPRPNSVEGSGPWRSAKGLNFDNSRSAEAAAEVPRLELFSSRDALVRRHAAWVLARCGALKENVDGHGGLLARRELEREQDNLLAVVRRALSEDAATLANITQALMALVALEPVMTTRGPHELFARLLDRTVDVAGPAGVTSSLLARTLELRARVRRARGQLAASKEDLTAALVLARASKDRLLEARALANLGTHAIAVADLVAARSAYDEAIAIVREQGNLRLEGRCVGFYGLLEEEQGNLAAAAYHYGAAIGIHQDTGDRRYEGIHLAQLARARAEAGDVDGARDLVRRALVIHRAVHNRRHEALALGLQGDIAAAEGLVDDAALFWSRAAGIVREVGDPGVIALLHARLAVAERTRHSDARAHDIVVDAALPRIDDPGLVGAAAILRGQPTTHAGVNVRWAHRIVEGLAEVSLDGADGVLS